MVMNIFCATCDLGVHVNGAVDSIMRASDFSDALKTFTETIGYIKGSMVAISYNTSFSESAPEWIHTDLATMEHMLFADLYEALADTLDYLEDGEKDGYTKAGLLEEARKWRDLARKTANGAYTRPGPAERIRPDESD